MYRAFSTVRILLVAKFVLHSLLMHLLSIAMIRKFCVHNYFVLELSSLQFIAMLFASTLPGCCNMHANDSNLDLYASFKRWLNVVSATFIAARLANRLQRSIGGPEALSKKGKKYPNLRLKSSSAQRCHYIQKAGFSWTDDLPVEYREPQKPSGYKHFTPFSRYPVAAVELQQRQLRSAAGNP